jgi:hypothetical protein
MPDTPSLTFPYLRSIGSVITCAAVIRRPVQLMKNAVPTHRTLFSPGTMATTGTILSPKTDLMVPPIGGCCVITIHADYAVDAILLLLPKGFEDFHR